ncbi:hypothetical protein Tco_0223720 [Tanacetum coccineum]
MSSLSAVTYRFVHSEEDHGVSHLSILLRGRLPRQLLEQAPRSPEYVPDPIEVEEHVPVYIPEPEHPEDLVPAEDEAPIEAYITEIRAAAHPPINPLNIPSGTPPLLPIPLPAPSTSRRADIPEADTPPRKTMEPTMPSVDCSSVDTVETRVQDTERGDAASEERRDIAYEQEIISGPSRDWLIRGLQQALRGTDCSDRDSCAFASSAASETQMIRATRKQIRVRNGVQPFYWFSGPRPAQAVRESREIKTKGCGIFKVKGTDVVAYNLSGILNTNVSASPSARDAKEDSEDESRRKKRRQEEKKQEKHVRQEERKHERREKRHARDSDDKRHKRDKGKRRHDSD